MSKAVKVVFPSYTQLLSVDVKKLQSRKPQLKIFVLLNELSREAKPHITFPN